MWDIWRCCILLALQLSRHGLHSMDNAEFCNMELFNVTCSKDEVLLVSSARYGRPHRGRCVRIAYGFLGCSTDVTSHVDRKCSGRRHCMFMVPGQDIHDTHPCPADFTSFLLVTYHCVRVHTSAVCVGRGAATLSALPGGYLQATVYQSVPHCPLTLAVAPGQSIQLTLFYFLSGYDVSPELDPALRHKRCTDVGIVRDGLAVTSMTVCQNDERQAVLYTSKTSHLEVLFVTSSEQFWAYLLRYDAVGCPDIAAAPGVSVERRGGESAIVRCNGSQTTSYLVCRGTAWSGDIVSSCYARPNQEKLVIKESFEELQVGTLLLIAVGIGLGVCCSGVTVVFVVVQLRRRILIGSTATKVCSKTSTEEEELPDATMISLPPLQCCGHAPSSVIASSDVTLRHVTSPDRTSHNVKKGVKLCTSSLVSDVLLNTQHTHTDPTHPH